MTASPPSKTKPSVSKNIPWLIALGAMLLAISALVLTWQLTQTIEHQTHHINTGLSLLNEQQANLEARLKNQHIHVQKTQATWQEKLNTLSNNLQDTRQEYNNLTDDWRLLKARHLLELAALNAHWGTDKDTTIAMLREADTILAPIHHSKLLAVREGLAHDLTEQLGAPTTDVTALLTRLDAIEARTFHLPIIALPQDQEDKEKSAEQTSEAPSNMGVLMKFLKNLVVIRHTTETLDPKPTLAYEAMLSATVRLNLQEATWAILERNDAVYHLALAQAVTNLERTFSSEATATQALIGQIKQLDTVALRTDIIIPDQALTALNQLINTPASSEEGNAS
ncbi:MAG: uroporphyrinogen-III C-methyltransferase [Legionellaceae bacterium]|nr:uroporphyrinogen-III C-methyltransferase [Legionellaceae bacterium]